MHPLLLLAVGALLVPLALPSAADYAIGPPAPASEPIAFSGGCPPSDYGAWLWRCLFVGSIQDPTLIFFRWDFEGDGIWDTPWRTELVVAHDSSNLGALRVTMQGWDGVSTRDREPFGPTASKNLVLGGALGFFPSAWDRSSIGWASLSWEVPAGVQPPVGRPADARIFLVGGSDGVRAFPLPRAPRLGLEPTVLAFRLDKASISQSFGPGSHAVFLWGHWGDFDFSTLPMTVTVL